MKIDVDAIARLRIVIKGAGTQQAAAEQLGIIAPYLCDLLRGRRAFSTVMLAKLGLRRTVIEATR